MVMEADR